MGVRSENITNKVILSLEVAFKLGTAIIFLPQYTAQAFTLLSHSKRLRTFLTIQTFECPVHKIEETRILYSAGTGFEIDTLRVEFGSRLRPSSP